MANGDDINKELDAAEESIEAQKAKLALEEKLISLRKELNSELKTRIEYEQDLEDIAAKRLRLVQEELTEEIKLNLERIEGGKLDADGLKVARDNIAAADFLMFQTSQKCFPPNRKSWPKRSVY
jgi:ATP-dependent protease HslVU (ClpYQ) ATPase subunit